MNIKKAAYVLFAALTAVTVFGCGSKEEPEKEEEIKTSVAVEIQKPEIKDISLSYNFSGTVQADDTVVIIPKIAGEVTEKHFEVGDHVNEGDLLFKIDDTSAKITLKQAEAALSQAQAGVTSQVAAQASTYASATETLGKIPSNDQQLATAVDSAYASAVQAGAQKDSANATSDFNKKNLENAEKAVNDAQAARDNAERNLAAARQSEDDSTIATAAAALQSAENVLKQAKTAKEQAELAKKTGENTAKSAEMQYYAAMEGYDNAVRNKQDYETYTVNSTLYGANAQMVGADAALTNSQAALKQAQAGVENAKLALEYTTVTSPVSGTITAINISEHNIASQTTQAYIIQSDTKEKIVFYVAEETRKSITPGNRALVTKNGTEYEAVIKNVESTIDQATGLFKVEAQTQGSTEGLISGSVVNLKTITRQSKGALTVPINCVYYDGEQAYVYVAQNGKAARRDITVGLSDDKDMEVVNGLSGEDQVIITYSAQLNDGSEIELTEGE